MALQAQTFPKFSCYTIAAKAWSQPARVFLGHCWAHAEGWPLWLSDRRLSALFRALARPAEYFVFGDTFLIPDCHGSGGPWRESRSPVSFLHFPIFDLLPGLVLPFLSGSPSGGLMSPPVKTTSMPNRPWDNSKIFKGFDAQKVCVCMFMLDGSGQKYGWLVAPLETMQDSSFALLNQC